MNNQEKIEAAGKKKEEGNVLFKAGKFARASKRYEKVIVLLAISNTSIFAISFFLWCLIFRISFIFIIYFLIYFNTFVYMRWSGVLSYFGTHKIISASGFCTRDKTCKLILFCICCWLEVWIVRLGSFAQWL